MVMSASTASACDAEPALRAFILGSLEDAPSLGVDDLHSPFPDLGRDIDETELDLSGICAWLDASTEPGVADPDAVPRCAPAEPREDDDASFFRDLLGAGPTSLEPLFSSAPPDPPRAAKRRKTTARDSAESNLGVSAETSTHDTARHESEKNLKSSDESSRGDDSFDEKSKASARLRRNRASAAASRARKRDEMTQLRRTVRELEKANAHLSYAAQCAFAENAALRCRLGFQPGKIVAPSPSAAGFAGPGPVSGPGFFDPRDAPPSTPAPLARAAERSHEKERTETKATEPAALDRCPKTVPVMPVDDDVPSSSKASLCAFFFSPFSRRAPPRDVRSRLRLGALRLLLARRRSRVSGITMWDAVVDARVLKRKTCFPRRDLERRGDETSRDVFAFFPARCEAARALSAAPRRATRKTPNRLGVSSPRRSTSRRSRVCRADTRGVPAATS